MTDAQSHISSAGKAENVTYKSLILAIETSSRVGSAALALGPELLEESLVSGPMQHSAELFPLVEGLLARHGYAPADIRQVHIAIGPGSFTGLRIAVTAAKAMHLAQGVRIVAVDSLDVLAANVSSLPAEPVPNEPGGRPAAIPDRIVTVFDAKRGQFYTAGYERVAPDNSPGTAGTDNGAGYSIPAPDHATWRKTLDDRLMTVQEILDGFAGAGPVAILGDGLLYHRDSFDATSLRVLPERYWSPRAANVHRLGYQKALAGRFEDPLTLTPFYLRGPQVTLKARP